MLGGQRAEQGGIPVAAVGQRQVIGALPADFGLSVDGLHLLVRIALGRAHLALVQHAQEELVGQLGVGDRAAETHRIEVHVLDGGAELAAEGPLAEALVRGQEGIGIGLPVLHLGSAVGAVQGTARQLGVGAREVLALVGDGAVVHADAAGGGEPVRDVPGEAAAEDIALAGLGGEVAVVDPVRVLHGDAGVADGPVLGVELTGGIPALIEPDVVPLSAAREQVSAHDRVVVQTLVAHVAVVLEDIFGADVQRHLVIVELGGVAELGVIAVVGRVRDDAPVVHGGSGQISLVLVVAGGQADGLGAGQAILEVVVPGIVTIVVLGDERKSVAADDGALGGIVVAGAVAVLEQRKGGDAGEFRVGGEGDLGLLGRTLLRVDDDGAVRGGGAVEGGRGRAGQYGDGLDVLRVDVGDRVGLARGTEFRGGVQDRGGHRHTVDHVDGVIVLADGLDAAHDGLRGAAHAGGRGVEHEARDLAAQGVDEVGILAREELVGIDLLHVIGKRLLLAADAESRDDGPFQNLVFLVERHVEDVAGPDGELERLVSQAGEFQGAVFVAGGKGELEVAVQVGAGADGGPLDHHGAADDGLARRIQDAAADRPGTGLSLADDLRGDHDGRPFDLPVNMDGREDGIERGFDSLAFDMDRDRLLRVDVHVDKQIVRLLLDALDRRFQRGLAEVQGNEHPLRAERSAAGKKHQQRQQNLAECCFLHVLCLCYLGCLIRILPS